MNIGFNQPKKQIMYFKEISASRSFYSSHVLILTSTFRSMHQALQEMQELCQESCLQKDFHCYGNSMFLRIQFRDNLWHTHERWPNSGRVLTAAQVALSHTCQLALAGMQGTKQGGFMLVHLSSRL